MPNFANAHITALQPYSPPLSGRSAYSGALLDFNERTIPPSPQVLAALREYFPTNQISRYPEYGNFTNNLAEYAQVQPQEIMITNGSDQGIDLIFRTFTKPGDEVIIPAPSFAMYTQCAGVMKNRFMAPLYSGPDLSFPLAEVLAAITPGTKLIVICNPNNPTGTLVAPEQIEQILRAAPQAIVYTDEAYFEFSGVTAAGLISKYPNLIVTRTFSKAFGLAALRVGYIISQEQNIQEMLKVRGPYDVNVPGYVAAIAALRDQADLENYTAEVMHRAKPLVEDFFRKKKIEFFPSIANFILFRPPGDALTMYEQLKLNGFLVRPQTHPQIKNTLRLTIGTQAQMQDFLQTFSTLL